MRQIVTLINLQITLESKIYGENREKNEYAFPLFTGADVVSDGDRIVS